MNNFWSNLTKCGWLPLRVLPNSLTIWKYLIMILKHYNYMRDSVFKAVWEREAEYDVYPACRLQWWLKGLSQVIGKFSAPNMLSKCLTLTWFKSQRGTCFGTSLELEGMVSPCLYLSTISLATFLISAPVCWYWVCVRGLFVGFLSSGDPVLLLGHVAGLLHTAGTSIFFPNADQGRNLCIFNQFQMDAINTK